MKIALVGNPNSGKSTLFNQLTSSLQHVGNFPGVSVEKKEGQIKDYNDFIVIDLPGIYSLIPYSLEEQVTLDYLLKEQVDVMINVVDSTNLRRNLYLTLQLLTLEKPMILVLSMMDDFIKSNHHLNLDLLKEKLQLPVISLSNFSLAKKELMTLLQTKLSYSCFVVFPEFIQDRFRKINHVDLYTINQVLLGNNKGVEIDKVNQIHSLFYPYVGSRWITFQYQTIDKILNSCLSISIHSTKTDQIDHYLLHPYLSFLFFFIVLLTIFFFSFRLIGVPLQNQMSLFFTFLIQQVQSQLQLFLANPIFIDFLCEGILMGIFGVLSFIPVLIVFFFFLALIDDSGYHGRIAFIMDHYFQKIGLSGRSCISLLVGLGCFVPALLSTRTLSDEKERRQALFLIPYLSCSAKIPVYGMLASLFFKQKAFFVIGFYYFLGIAILILLGLFSNHSEESLFFLELPPYRKVKLKNIYYYLKKRVNDFVRKTFTLILFGSILIWFLQSFTLTLTYTKDSSLSILALFSKQISLLFYPIGLKDWRLVISLIMGLFAKELVVSTLIVLFGSRSALQLQLTIPTVLSFLTFFCLYPPCLASFTVLKSELGSFKQAFKQVVFQFLMAYLISWILYHLI